MSEKPSQRLLALDYLRGFFIVVIIIDHLWRWPSLYEAITGKGQLWVTAAEGFVIISGLLVGYIRGYKNRDTPLLEVSVKLWKRALLLYLWLVIMSLVYTALMWYVPTQGTTVWIEIAKGDWNTLIMSSITMTDVHTWVYFLYIYALLLAVTPAFVWLLRRRLIWAVVLLTFIGYTIGRITTIEWLQWMPMFFLPAIAGYYMPSIQKWWQGRSTASKRGITTGLFALAGFTLLLSVICTFILPHHPIAAALNHAFTKEVSFNVARIPIALLWFAGLVMLFEYCQKFIGRWFGWLLLPFGLRSLTAYILHGGILFLIAFLLIDRSDVWYNTLIGTGALLATLVLIKLPFIQKVVPR